MCVPCGCLREPPERDRQREPAHRDRQIPGPARPSTPNGGRRRVSSGRRAHGIERAEDTRGMQQSRTSHVRGDPPTRSQRHSVSPQKRVPDRKPLRPPPTLRHGGGIVAPKSRTIRFSRIVDLSQPIGPDTQMFPAYPAPRFTQWTTREVHGFFAESMWLVSHTGTHVDAPFHFEPKGRKLHEMPLDRFIAPGPVFDLRGPSKKGRILPQHLRTSMPAARRSIQKGDAILLRSGWWERHRGTPAYLFDSPGLAGAGANFLLDLGVGLVGVDTASIDHPDDATYPAHHALLGANVPVIENVANLSALGSSAFWLLALPLNLQGTSGSPIRLVALAE